MAVIFDEIREFDRNLLAQANLADYLWGGGLALLVAPQLAAGLLYFFVRSSDPMFLLLTAIVGLGVVLTLSCFLLERSGRSRGSADDDSTRAQELAFASHPLALSIRRLAGPFELQPQ